MLTKGYMSLWPMQVWGLHMPLLESTPRVAAAAGAPAFGAVGFSTQPFNIHFQNVGSI